MDFESVEVESEDAQPGTEANSEDNPDTELQEILMNSFNQRNLSVTRK